MEYITAGCLALIFPSISSSWNAWARRLNLFSSEASVDGTITSILLLDKSTWCRCKVQPCSLWAELVLVLFFDVQARETGPLSPVANMPLNHPASTKPNPVWLSLIRSGSRLWGTCHWGDLINPDLSTHSQTSTIAAFFKNNAQTFISCWIYGAIFEW